MRSFALVPALLAAPPAVGQIPARDVPLLEWEALAPLPGAGCELASPQRLALEPDVVFASTSAGIVRSDDDGRTWSLFAGWPGQRSRPFRIAVHPIDPNRIAVASAIFGAPFLSHDGGLTWFTPSVAPASDRVVSVASDPIVPDRVYYGAGDGVWRSTDGGDTFVHVHPTGAPVRELIVDRNDRLRIVGLSLDRTLHRSEDGGDTWTSHPVPLSPGGLPVLAMDPGNGLRLVAGDLEVLVSEDGGTTWTAAAPLPGRLVAADFDVVDDDRLYASTSDGLFTSDDRGGAWTRSTDSGLDRMGGGPRAILASVADPGHVLCFGRGGVARSVDGARSFVRANDGLDAHASVFDVALLPGLPDGLVAKTGGSAFVSSDGGATWTESVAGPGFHGPDLVVDAGNPSRLWCGGLLDNDGGGHQLWRSDDGGLTFHVVFQDPTLYFWHLEAPQRLPGVLFGAGRGLHRSDDGGVTWTDLGVPASWVWDVDTHPAAPGHWIASTDAGIYATSDSGATWSFASTPWIVRELAFDPNDPLVAFAAAPGPLSGVPSLLRTLDGGATWVPVADSLPASQAVHASSSRPGLVLANDYRRAGVVGSVAHGDAPFTAGRGIPTLVLSFASNESATFACTGAAGLFVLR